MTSPFVQETDLPLVALRGVRNGYIQLATSQEITRYGSLPDGLFLAAKAWASVLEDIGAHRVYWITLSEQVQHLHIHLYPRWEANEIKGIALFEQRDAMPQPAWTEAVQAALNQWIKSHQVFLSL